jgi:DUF971 family protein
VTDTPVSATGSPTSPRTIHADREGRRLQIEWRDGHATTYDFVPLRWLCPCAFCRGEAGMPGWLDSRPTLTDEQTRMVDIHMIGNYAVAPEWGDGHHTGFYTFAMLRERCPCDDCRSRRVMSGDPEARGGHLSHERHAPDGPAQATAVHHEETR